MTIIIHHIGSPNLSVLIVQLQPQLHPSDDIYLIGNQETLRIANMYGTTRCYIFVEVGNYTTKEAIDFGIQSAKENKQKGVLVLNENSVISATLITNFKRELKKGMSPTPSHVQAPYPQMPSNFQWYYPDFKSEVIVLLPVSK